MTMHSVPDTYADTTEPNSAIGYKPGTPVKQCIKAFIDCYRAYYG